MTEDRGQGKEEAVGSGQRAVRCGRDPESPPEDNASPAEQPEENEPQSPLDAVWRAAPLASRIAFLRGVLGTEDPWQAALAGAGELDALPAVDLAAWIERYPSLFADAYARLCLQPDPSGDPTAELASRVVDEARAALDGRLGALEIEPVLPRYGTSAARCEIVGEEHVEDLPAGRVARVVRPGLRRRGELLLPAQAMRSANGPHPPACSPESLAAPAGEREPADPCPGPSPTGSRGELSLGRGSESDQPSTPTVGSSEAPGEKAKPTEDSSPLLPGEGPVGVAPGGPGSPPFSGEGPGEGSGERPDWLRSLQHAGRRGGSTALDEVLGGLTALGDRPPDLPSELVSLLPLLGPPRGDLLERLPEEWLRVFWDVRPKLIAWLERKFAVRVIWPAAGDRFDPGRMECVGERRTAHAHERGTVAKVEQVGLSRENELLFPAKVVLYESGGWA